MNFLTKNALSLGWSKFTLLTFLSGTTILTCQPSHADVYKCPQSPNVISCKPSDNRGWSTCSYKILKAEVATTLTDKLPGSNKGELRWDDTVEPTLGVINKDFHHKLYSCRYILTTKNANVLKNVTVDFIAPAAEGHCEFSATPGLEELDCSGGS